MRLDVYLVENGYFSTRSKATQAIKEGFVLVNNRKPFKAGLEVNDSDNITIKSQEYNFVSRGGYKLLGAIKEFKLHFENKIVLDIGASTGGFTDCAIQFGAKKVYAYDVGHDQLDPSLKENPKIVMKEGINCRNLTKEDFKEQIDFIVMDVSFISCTKMFEAISNILEKDKEAIILFKPQFEVGSQNLNNKGIVVNEQVVYEKFKEAIEYAKQLDLGCISYAVSPIKGGDGNKEYLLHLVKGNEGKIKEISL